MNTQMSQNGTQAGHGTRHDALRKIGTDVPSRFPILGASRRPVPFALRVRK